MPRVTFNRLSKKRSSVRKRRTSTITKARYKPRTTYANRSLIKSNAYAIRSIKRLMPPSVYTDYQYGFCQQPFPAAPDEFFNLINAELMSPTLWNPVLRQDQNVIESSMTMLKRLQINLRYDLGEANWCQITTFVVSIRKDAANRIINQSNLTLGEDYIYSPQQQFNVRLNPAVFKCHYVRNVSLMGGAWQQDTFQSAGDVLVSQSSNTFAKGQVNLKFSTKLKQPLGTSWRTMDQSQLMPQQRYFLLSFFKGQQTQVDDVSPSVCADCLYTCFNSG
ncbi:MAG: putative capsid protein [Circoviridae sp.]|nr:MAG: putative capsid protein [Circoviridae sp.]